MPQVLKLTGIKTDYFWWGGVETAWRCCLGERIKKRKPLNLFRGLKDAWLQHHPICRAATSRRAARLERFPGRVLHNVNN